MLKVKVKDEQISYVRNLLESVNFGRRGDGTKDITMEIRKQFVGILGQVVVADLFDQKDLIARMKEG